MMRASFPADSALTQPFVQEGSCVSSMIGSRSFGETSVLNPNATANAGAVPLSHALLRAPRMQPRALRRLCCDALAYNKRAVRQKFGFWEHVFAFALPPGVAACRKRLASAVGPLLVVVLLNPRLSVLEGVFVTARIRGPVSFQLFARSRW